MNDLSLRSSFLAASSRSSSELKGRNAVYPGPQKFSLTSRSLFSALSYFFPKNNIRHGTKETRSWKRILTSPTSFETIIPIIIIIGSPSSLSRLRTRDLASPRRFEFEVRFLQENVPKTRTDKRKTEKRKNTENIQRRNAT